MGSRQEPLRRTYKTSDTGVDTSRSPTQLSADAAGTRERDANYDLVSILYHALQGAETYVGYIQDARREGDRELAEFFEDCRDEDAERADRARQLLAGRWNDLEDDEDDDAADQEVERKLDDAWSDY
jgi:hypothetical protein